MTKAPATPLLRDGPLPTARLAFRLILLGGLAPGALAAAFGVASSGDPVTAGRTLAENGTSAGVPACGDCHGTAGIGKADAPRLAGSDAAYLREQLVRYAAGKRRDAAMSKIAAAMDAPAIRAAAAYFARQPAPAPSSSRVSAEAEAGAVLALRGDWGHGVPPCAACHGMDGGGVGAAFPAVAGQPAPFTAAQLQAWRSGARSDDPLGLMRKAAAHLSDAQIAALAAYDALAPGTPVALPPDPPIPDAALGKTISLGAAIFRDPSAHAGTFVGNTLTCENCHLDAGRLAGSGPLGAAYVAYPAYRRKEGRVITFAERLQGCFRYSMNGKAPPLGDATLVALESYAFFLAKGLPTGMTAPGRGYARLAAAPPLGLDFGRGATVFAAKCAICHGKAGQGQTAGGRTVFPPLWGPKSFNWGAGMSSIDAAAGFIKANMPFGQGFSLSDQEAWDVATFVDAHERPQDPRFTGDLAATRARFHDDPMSLYGKTVNGALLGEFSPPAGPAGGVGIR